MKRIHQAIAENATEFTKGQHLLAAFVTEHCDKAAFMSSFELAAVTGVSQSTVIRFASALGYQGYGDLQNALQMELKYRLTTLERFELMDESHSSDADLLNAIAINDTLNIKKVTDLNPLDSLHNLCTRLMLSGRIYVYGQGFSAAAAIYLSTYLRILLPNVCCINQMGLEPLSAASGLDAGDLLLCMCFPPQRQATLDLVAYAKEKEACVAVISESNESAAARESDICLVSECGDFGLGGSMAPLISLCCMIVCLLTRSDEKAQRKLNSFTDASAYRGETVE